MFMTNKTNILNDIHYNNSDKNIVFKNYSENNSNNCTIQKLNAAFLLNETNYQNHYIQGC